MVLPVSWLIAETSSAHLKEPDCAVTRALQAGEIQTSRYDSYVRLYEKASQIKEWERG